MKKNRSNQSRTNTVIKDPIKRRKAAEKTEAWRTVMTYKIEPGLGRITSPITLLFPDGAKKEYQSGKELCEMAFDRKYRVTEIRAFGDRIEIKLETLTTPIINPIGEETFF